jgi:tripartite-type tricarboxylate transporter receptor subunit TctC
MLRTILALCAGAFWVLVTGAHAQPYPSKQIEIVVPFAPGGTTDFTARVIAQKLSESWRQPVLVLNKPGASGGLGAELAAQSPPDGYTLLVTGYVSRLLLFGATPPASNPAKDLLPVAMVTKAPLLLLVHPDLPVKTLNDLLALARSKPGALNYASIGNGSQSHLTMEMVRKMAGVNLTHIPYKGSAPALVDLIGGHVPVMFDSVVSSSTHVKAGKLRALAVTTATRLPLMPDLPTMVESGLPGFDVSTWAALYTPPGVSQDKVEKLRAEVVRILKLPDVIERFTFQGALVPEPMTQAQVAAFIKDDIAGWRKLIQDANIQAE